MKTGLDLSGTDLLPGGLPEGTSSSQCGIREFQADFLNALLGSAEAASELEGLLLLLHLQATTKASVVHLRLMVNLMERLSSVST
jgi:hypothetical protein